jgi:hypothetical protein
MTSSFSDVISFSNRLLALNILQHSQLKHLSFSAAAVKLRFAVGRLRQRLESERHDDIIRRVVSDVVDRCTVHR